MVAGPGFYTYEMTSSLPTARVAVIMRTFERPVLLARAIASVQNQTLADWVLVIVNNGGDPRAVDAIVKIAAQSSTQTSQQILVLHLDECVNPGAASNRGLAQCDSDYFVLHDDDDTWSPDFLKVMVSALDSQKTAAAGVAGSALVLETQRGNRLWPIHEAPQAIEDGQLTFTSLIAGRLFSSGAVLLRRSLTRDVGAFDESIPMLDDWEYLVRIAEQYSLVAIHETLMRHHVRSVRSEEENVHRAPTSVELELATRDLIVDRWLHVTMPNGLNKGQLAITAAGARQADESVRSMENWRIRVEELEHVVRDLQLSIAGDIANQNIAHQIVHIIEQRRLWRRIARVLLSPAHGLRAIKRRIAA